MAASFGHVHVMEWADKHACPRHNTNRWDTFEVAEMAARQAHLSCLEWALEHSLGASDELNWWAALGGDFECLQVARQHSAAWDMVPETLAGDGTLSMLRWAIENGCPWWRPGVCRKAITDLDFLIFASSSGAHLAPSEKQILVQARRSTVLLCHKHGAANIGRLPSELVHIILLVDVTTSARFRKQSACSCFLHTQQPRCDTATTECRQASSHATQATYK